MRLPLAIEAKYPVSDQALPRREWLNPSPFAVASEPKIFFSLSALPSLKICTHSSPVDNNCHDTIVMNYLWSYWDPVLTIDVPGRYGAMKE